MTTPLTRQDLIDAVHGASIFGSGGGGQLSEGLSYVDLALSTAAPLTLTPLSAAPPTALIAAPILLGTVAPTPAHTDPAYARLPQPPTPPIAAALRLMEARLGARLAGVFPVELGASNVGVAFYAAALTGGMVVDADATGRSVPEKSQSTYAMAGVACSPIAAANAFGERFVVEDVHDDERAERVMRAICVVSREDVAVVDHAMEVRGLREVLIGGSVGRCVAMGRAVREAREGGRDVAETVAGVEGGRVVFRGVVEGGRWGNEGGFTVGEVRVGGTGGFEGRGLRLEVKNEFMAGWVDGRLLVSVPEIIVVVGAETGEAVLNPVGEEKVGMAVAVVVLKAPQPFLTEKGLQTFGPAYLGLSEPFRSALEDAE